MSDRINKLKNAVRVTLLAFVLPLAVGCGGVVGEVALVVTVIKLVAIGTTAVLAVQGIYWTVESARLDAERKQLILDGMKDGQQATAVVDLTDEQLETIQETGKMKIMFEDGREVEVTVER